MKNKTVTLMGDRQSVFQNLSLLVAVADNNKVMPHVTCDTLCVTQFYYLCRWYLTKLKLHYNSGSTKTPVLLMSHCHYWQHTTLLCGNIQQLSSPANTCTSLMSWTEFRGHDIKLFELWLVDTQAQQPTSTEYEGLTDKKRL